MIEMEITQGNSSLERKVSSVPLDNRSTFRKVTDVYFRPKFFEKSGKLYEALGVKYSQKAILGTFGKVIISIRGYKSAGEYFIGKKRDLKSLRIYEKRTKFNELIHAPQVVLNVGMLEHYISEENYGWAVFWGGLLVLNTSFVILQRYNRARVDKLIKRAEERKR